MPRPLYSHVLNLRKDMPTAGSITRSMLAPGASVGNTSTAPIFFSTATTGSYVKVVDLPSITLRAGALVWLVGNHGLYYTNAAATVTDIWLKWVRDSVTDLNETAWRFGVAATLPVPPLVAADLGPPAGAHVYSLYTRISPGGSTATIATASGAVAAYEVS